MAAHCSATLDFNLTVDYVLVYWPEEDCVSVVPTKNVVDPCPPILEETCTVQTAKKTYTGITVAMGTPK